jgi:hypothetical protein
MAYKNSKAQAAIGVVLSIGPKASAYTGSPISITGDTTSASASITSVSSLVGLLVGQTISGTGIPTGATIATISAPSTITISANATATGSDVALSVGPFIPLNEVSVASSTGQKWTLEDITNFNSMQYMEYLKTLLDTGKIPLTFNRVSTDPGQKQLYTAFLDSVAYEFQISLPLNQDQVTTGDSLTFAGLVDEWNDTVQVGKVIKTAAGIQRTGAITPVAGS